MLVSEIFGSRCCLHIVAIQDGIFLYQLVLIMFFTCVIYVDVVVFFDDDSI